MGSPAEKLEERYTYADYLTWEDGKRWELIEGIPYCLASPSADHQRLVLRIASQFDRYLEGKSCEAFVAPFDVILTQASEKNEEIETVLQPDLFVNCNPATITQRACAGTPDMVIEVLSPSTFKRDLNDKFRLYEEAGVKVYWIVSPGETSVVVYELDDKGVFQETGIYEMPEDEQVPVALFKDFRIDLKRIFR